VINHQVNQSESADHCTGEKNLGVKIPPDHIGVDDGDHCHGADPNLAMIETKFMPERSRPAILKRVAIRQSIGQVNQPGREKERNAINWIDGRTKSSGEEPKPGDGHEGSVETNQVEPNQGRLGRDSARYRPRTPRDGLPTRIDPT